jgi:pheromone shutdown protein TraB
LSKSLTYTSRRSKRTHVKMTKQWHDPKIAKKPCNRYNPSLQSKIGSVYRPWFLVVTFLAFFIGIALVGCAAQIRVLNSDVSDEVFHLWIGIPLVFLAIFALICFITKRKKVAVAFLVVAFVIMVICGVGALVGGVRYWMDGWQRVKQAMDNNKCSDNNNLCQCTGITSMPSSNDCDDMETIINLIIAEFALSAFGFVASVIGVYLSFMAICCGPWLYMEWYDEENDPDFTGERVAVKHVSGNTNPSFGGGNPYATSNY